jgi:GLPGLI family protein
MCVRKPPIFRYIFALLLIVASCSKQKNQANRIDEGYITYDIEYMGDSLEKFVKAFLPGEMKLFFKNHNTKNHISDATGMIAFTHIKNHAKGIQTSLVDIFSHKYKYIENLGEESIFFQSESGIRVEKLDETKRIAGYLCRKARVTHPHSENPGADFNIYYTDQIDIAGFTQQTPFRGLEGVLMEFQIEMYHIPMKLIATEIKTKQISEEIFSIPPGYKAVNKKTMKEIMELLKER